MRKIFNSFKSTPVKQNIKYVVNPYTNQPIHELEYHNLEDKIEKIEQTKKATLTQFKKMAIKDRIGMIEKVLTSLMREKSKIVEEVSLSTGKPITQSNNDFNNSLKHARQYINLYTKFSEDINLVRTSQPHGISFFLLK